MSIWVIAVGCLTIGIVIGVMLTDKLSTNSKRVRHLEAQITTLKESHEEYRESVSDHFSKTAELVHRMTEDYKGIYQHLASGAQNLCSTEVAGKLLPTESDATFEASYSGENSQETIAPRDYAARTSPDRIGALSENFGIEKPD